MYTGFSDEGSEAFQLLPSQRFYIDVLTHLDDNHAHQGLERSL